MRTNILRAAGAAVLMLIFLAAGAALQGCGSESNGFVAGPQAGTSESPETSMLESRGWAGDAAAQGPGPDLDCHVLRTAYVEFRNASERVAFDVAVNGEYYGTLKPAGILRLKLKEGIINWEATPHVPLRVPIQTGKLELQRCENYTVKLTWQRPSYSILDPGD